VFAPKRDEMVRGWRKPRIKALHNLYCSQGIIRMIKFRRIRWAKHVAHMGRIGIHVGVWCQTQNERHHGEEKYVGEGIIL
jgi:hypothetical protein